MEKIYFHSDGNLEIHLKYDDFMEQLTEIAEERIVGRMQEVLALYMRLSDEDDNIPKGAESNSISHQRQLMMEYVSGRPDLQGYQIAEFVDDGYSGADFTRPNFQKMMDMVKAGSIGVIITKDYSRLGRDYLEVGNYMECIFPLMQVRYISVNDGYDSRESFGSTGGNGCSVKEHCQCHVLPGCLKESPFGKEDTGAAGEIHCRICPVRLPEVSGGQACAGA